MILEYCLANFNMMITDSVAGAIADGIQGAVLLFFIIQINNFFDSYTLRTHAE